MRIYGDSIPVGSSMLWLRGSHIAIENIKLFNAKNSGIYLCNNIGSTEQWMRHVIVKNVWVDNTFSHGVIARFIENQKYEDVTVVNGQQENEGTSTTCQWGSALRAELSKQVIISRCTTFHNKGEGINLASSIHGLIENCVSYDNFAPNFYLIRDQKVTFRNNLSYNVDSMYWRNCKPGGGGYVERVPTAGLSIANEVGYDDFPPGYICNATRNHGSGFVNNISDSLFIYNNIFMMAPLYIIDESFGDLFCLNVHANNFSNIYIEYITLIGQVNRSITDYANKKSLISMIFNPTYFQGCLGDDYGKAAYRVHNMNFHSNILSHVDSVHEEAIDIVSIVYGGRPCNGGDLGSKFSSSNNVWSRMPDSIVDHHISTYARVANFLFNASTDAIHEDISTVIIPIKISPYTIYPNPAVSKAVINSVTSIDPNIVLTISNTLGERF